METGDFPSAIELSTKCQQDIFKYRHFQAVLEMSTKFQGINAQIESRIESYLVTICKKFEPRLYEGILIGLLLTIF